MDDYKTNIDRSKTTSTTKESEKKKIAPVVKSPVVMRKKSGVSKMKDLFISEDASNIKNYVFLDVLVPAIKKAVSDIVTDGIDMILYGGNGGRNKDRRSSISSKVSYAGYYDRRDRDRDRYRDDGYKRNYKYEDVVIRSHAEAEEVIERMYEMIDQYQVVSIADLNELLDISGDYTDNRYGWTSLRSAKVVRVRDGYVLDLPKACPID